MRGTRKATGGTRGFTLLEITVVITIIGVLAAIAVPAFTKYIRKADTSEARINLSTIHALERAYYIDHRSFLPCPPTPQKVPQGPVRWPSGECWEKLGFRPDGLVLYQYEVVVEPGKSGFAVRAHGDLDRDGKSSTFEMSSQGSGIWRKNELE